jgi:hypothetical protein
MNLIKTSCIRIPQQFESEIWCQSILQDLTRSGPSFEDPTVMQTIRFYDRRDGYIMIPRYYDVSNWGHSTLDYTPEGLDIQFKFKTSWRNDLQSKGFEFLINNDHGILKLPPGEGKTVVAIGAICHIAKKAIIFVHKDSLSIQWKERFLQHSTVTENDISILKTDSSFEDLQKPIVLATVQTMNSMIDRLPNIEKLLLQSRFGVAFWDECHTTAGAEKYSKSSLYLPCRRVFGLSATPGRADQNHDIIWKHVGMVHEPDGKTMTMDPKIVMVYFDHKAVALHKKYIYWGAPLNDGKYKLPYPKFDTARYLQMLTSKKNDKYIQYMRKIVRQLYDKGRVILFISDRIKVLDMTSSAIPVRSDIGFFIPRSGDKRDSDLLKQVVFSTPGSSRDGTDREQFNCLVMANCISNIEQAVGRVCRYLPNKPQPIVMDIVDSGCPELLERAQGRLAFYKNKNWEVIEKRLN